MLKKLRLKSFLLFIISVFVFVGCSSNQDQKSTTEAEFSAMDLMFASMMIPHHEQAIVMSDLALKNSSNEMVLDLAQRIKDGQDPEVAQMQSWLEQTGVSSGSMMDDHAMHGGMMGGMATDQDIEELSRLSSPEFDKLFLDLMILHHQGAIQMVQMIQNSSNPEVRQLAEDIVKVQNLEIQEMKALKSEINNSQLMPTIYF